MKKIKCFQCNIKKDKVYVVFFKPEAIMGMRKQHVIGYVHKKFISDKVEFWGFAEITEDGNVKPFDENDGMTYEEYIKDYMDYDYDIIDTYEFDSLKQALPFIKKVVLTKKLRR